jgi:hypothetical protein
MDFSIAAAYLYGPIDGYVQVPAGGERGTTSKHRPTFGELGIDRVSAFDFTVKRHWDRNVVFVGGQFDQLTGKAVLDSDLISHGDTFAAGTAISSRVVADWAHLGYGRQFDLNRTGQWTLTPSAAAAIMVFDYELRGGSQSVSRSYVKPTFQVGADLEWNPNNGPFALSLSLDLTPPLPDLAWIDEESIKASYRLLRRGNTDLRASLGVVFQQIRFEDRQTVSNHTSIDLGPMFMAQMELSF